MQKAVLMRASETAIMCRVANLWWNTATRRRRLTLAKQRATLCAVQLSTQVCPGFLSVRHAVQEKANVLMVLIAML